MCKISFFLIVLIFNVAIIITMKETETWNIITFILTNIFLILPISYFFYKFSKIKFFK